jgi:hypothetical protein
MRTKFLLENLMRREPVKKFKPPWDYNIVTHMPIARQRLHKHSTGTHLNVTTVRLLLGNEAVDTYP